MMPYNHHQQHQNTSGSPMGMSRNNHGKHNNNFHHHQHNMNNNNFGMGGMGGMMQQQHHHQQQQNQQRSAILKNEVFVGNLSYFCDENDLYQLFDSYADVTHVRIVRNAENNRTLMFGFVTLSTVNEAKEMSKLLTGQLFMGRKLRVDVCFQNHDPKSNPHTNPGDEGYQLHVSFSSNFMLLDGVQQQQLIRPTEFMLRKIFIKFGTLVDASVKEYNIEPTIQEGYGFVTFESFEDATRVPKQITVQGINFLCSLTHKHNPMFKHGMGGGNMNAGHHGRQHQQGHHQQQHSSNHHNSFGNHQGGGVHGFHHGGLMNDMASMSVGGPSISREHSDSIDYSSKSPFDNNNDIIGGGSSRLDIIAPSGFGGGSSVSSGGSSGGLLNLNAKHGPMNGSSMSMSLSSASLGAHHHHMGAMSSSGSNGVGNNFNSNSSSTFSSLNLNGHATSAANPYTSSLPPVPTLSIVDRFIGLSHPPSANVGGSEASSPSAANTSQPGLSNNSNSRSLIGAATFLGPTFDASSALNQGGEVGAEDHNPVMLVGHTDE